LPIWATINVKNLLGHISPYGGDGGFSYFYYINELICLLTKLDTFGINLAIDLKWISYFSIQIGVLFKYAKGG